MKRKEISCILVDKTKVDNGELNTMILSWYDNKEIEYNTEKYEL